MQTQSNRADEMEGSEMKRLMAARKGQLGFTLIELIVVIAIMGVLAAVAIPSFSSFLEESKGQSAVSELERIRSAVENFRGDTNNERFIGLRQYPLLGKDQTNETSTIQLTAAAELKDQGNPFSLAAGDLTGTTTVGALWNPVGGTEGADLSGTWVDGTTVGVRLLGSGTNDAWTTVRVTRGGEIWYTDPRYFFIDFEALVANGQLQNVPESAAPDHKPPGSTVTYTGSYIYYVGADGQVRVLYTELPSEADFVDGVFP